jgi:hypothetical protein
MPVSSSFDRKHVLGYMYSRCTRVTLIIKASGFKCPRLENRPLLDYPEETGSRCPIVIV